MNKIECLDAAKQASLAAGKKLKASFFETQELVANSGRENKSCRRKKKGKRS